MSPRNGLALEMRWHEGALPVRILRGPRRQGPDLLDVPPWTETGPSDRPFDFSGHVRRLLEGIVVRTPEFAGIQVPRILVSAIQARKTRAHGLQARVTALRFTQGQLQRRRRGTLYQVQRYFAGEHEFLYLMTFCLPRFLDQGFDDKFITLFHELYHIGPDFDGDLRRHHGRYQLHTHSQKHYDAQMAGLARDYLASRPDPNLHSFLRLDFAQLQARHGGIAAIVVPRPKMIPVAEPVMAP